MEVPSVTVTTRPQEKGNTQYGIEDVFDPRRVAELHGVHLGPGNATTTHRARVPLGDLQFPRDARDRVWSDFDPMPLLDHALGPDPNGLVRGDRLQLIDGTPSPIGAACYEEQRCYGRASRHQDFHTFYRGICGGKLQSIFTNANHAWHPER